MKNLKKFLILLLFVVLVSACASTGDNYETANENEEVSINEDDNVYFGLNKYTLSKEAKAILDAQAEKYKDQDINITIEGRCDERGTREYNLALGERRANSVKQYLVKKGIPAKRIKTISYGKEDPLVVGSGEEVWAKNRVASTVEEK